MEIPSKALEIIGALYVELTLTRERAAALQRAIVERQTSEAAAEAPKEAE